MKVIYQELDENLNPKGIERTLRYNWLPVQLREDGLVNSSSEALRLIRQGGVQVNGKTVGEDYCFDEPGNYVVRVGKRKFIRYKVRRNNAKKDD